MKIEVLIQMLRNRQEQLCCLAADELERLEKEVQELRAEKDQKHDV